MSQTIEVLIDELRQRRQLKSLKKLTNEMSLKRDLGLDSLDIAVLAIRIQEVFKVDIFSSNRFATVGDLRSQLGPEDA